MNLVRFNRPAQKHLSHLIDDFFTSGFNDIFDKDFSKKIPSTNILEKDNSFIIELAAPGLKKDDFKINIENNQLLISTEKKEEKTESSEKYTRREFNYTSFKKSFHLSKEIDRDKIGAKYEDGILRLTLEKKEEAKVKEPRHIKVG